MKGLVIILPLVCVLVQCNKEKCSGKTSKRDDIFSPEEIADMQNLFQQNSHTDDEIRAAFPVMDAFKEHSLFSHDELKDATQSDYQYSGDQIQDAVDAALRRLHKKKAEFEKVVNENTADADSSTKAKEHNHSNKRKKINSKEIIDEIVENAVNEGKKKSSDKSSDELKDSNDEGDKSSDELKESNDEGDKSSDELKESNDKGDKSSDEVKENNDEGNSSTGDKQIHHKLAEITAMEEKLSHLIRDVKKYLTKKKGEMPEHHGSAELNDDDDIERILLRSRRKRSGIPHVGTLEKFRKNPHLVDKYMASIFSESENTQQGDQRDLLGKKDMDVALLKQAVPGEFDSVPISRLEQESERMESMATDRGMARDVLVESPFSVLDVKKETGKKFRHNLS